MVKNKIKLYELAKDIVSPQFQYTIQAGREFTMNQIKSYFPSIDELRFNEFFKESEKYEIVNCRKVEKVKSDNPTK